MNDTNSAVGTDPRVTRDGDTLTRIRTRRGELILLGTAHVSEDSAREVDLRIRDFMPRTVCIELDENRYRSLNQENSWKNLDIYQIIRQKKTFLLLSNLVLSAYQKRLGLNLGTKPGDEMRAAVKTSAELSIPTAMVDRDIQVTLTRAWRKTGFWGRNKIMAVLIGSAFSREELDEEAIESLKQRSALDDMMKEMAEFLPSVKEVLIDERDRYLAIKTWQTAARGEIERPVLAVVGAGHVPGMIAKILELDDAADAKDTAETAAAGNDAASEGGAAEFQAGRPVSEELEDISRVPAPGIVGKVLPWLVVAAIAGLIISGFITKGWEGGLQSLWRWILVNGTLSAIGAAAALAHPLTVISSFLAAPVTSMNPTIGVGFVTGILESLLRKPRVEDFENLGDDITSFRGFFRNRITRILMVFFFSSIGSAIGTFVALPLLFP
jgi:pheromone shutdown protein TraB